MLKAILEQQGILNVEDYLTPPEQLPPPQPDPAAEMQMRASTPKKWEWVPPQGSFLFPFEEPFRPPP